MKPSLHLKAVLPLLALTLSASPVVFAQTGVPTASTKKPRARRSGISAKKLEAIEAKLGRKVTPAEKSQLDAAADRRRDAVKAADEQFNADVARATGLAEQDVKRLGKKSKGKKKGSDATGLPASPIG